MTELFEIAEPCSLYATGTPERLEVYRTVLIKDRHKIYQPVSRFVRGHGMVLNATVADEDETMMFGQAEYSIYTRPGAPAESTDGMSFYMAALRCGVPFEEYFAGLVKDGLVLEHPGGGYVPSPHPDIIDRYPAAGGR